MSDFLNYKSCGIKKQIQFNTFRAQGSRSRSRLRSRKNPFFFFLDLDLDLLPFTTKKHINNQILCLKKIIKQQSTMNPIKFLLSLTGFFVYISTINILHNSRCFAWETNTLFDFVCWIKQFILEMGSGVPP